MRVDFPREERNATKSTTTTQAFIVKL